MKTFRFLTWTTHQEDHDADYDIAIDVYLWSGGICSMGVVVGEHPLGHMNTYVIFAI